MKLRRRPLIGPAICFVTGTLAGLKVSAPFHYPLACAWLALAAVLIYRKRSTMLSAFLCAAIFFAGWTSSTLRSGQQRFEAPVAGEHEYTGIIIDDPIPASTTIEGGTTWRFRFQPDIGGQALLVRIRDWKKTPPAYGDRWKLKGQLKSWLPPSGNEIWLMTIRWFNAEHLSRGNSNPFVSWCYASRQEAGGYLLAGVEDFPHYTSLLRALVLGYRHELTHQQREVFANTGTLHILAISGLHVGIIALFITFILRSLRVSRMHWAIVLIPLMVIYTVSTGARASAIRACTMICIYYSASLFHRKADVFSSLALAAILILGISPGQLVETGFIFSFVIVTGLVLLHPVIEQPFRKLYLADPFAPAPDMVDEEQKKAMRWDTRRRAVIRYIASLFAMSLSAWLISAPLTAYFFGRISPISIIGNMLVIPLTFSIVMSGCLSLLLGPLWLIMADIFNHAGVALTATLMTIVETLNSIPFGSIELGHMPLWWVLTWYLLIAAIAWLVRRREFSMTNDK